MARETKAERLAREAMEREERHMLEVQTYPVRLMALLERASKLGFNLEVLNGTFRVAVPNSDEYFLFNYGHSGASEDNLHDLEWRVGAREREQAEENRRFMLKQAALKKLSEEEREVLGLPVRNCNW